MEEISPLKNKESPINISLSNNGELRFSGEVKSPQELEVFQQLLDESHSRSRQAQKIEDLIQLESFLQGVLVLSVISFFLFTVCFATARVLLKPQSQEVSYARRFIS